MASPLQDFLDVKDENDYQDRMASEDALLNHAVANLDTSKPVNAIMQDLYQNYGKNDSTLINALLNKPLKDVSPLEEVEQHFSGNNLELGDNVGNFGNVADSSPFQIPWSTGAYLATGTKSGQKLLTKGLTKTIGKAGAKTAMRFIPGVGWALVGADVLDYLLPKGYSPYNLFGLVGDNPVSKTLSWKE